MAKDLNFYKRTWWSRKIIPLKKNLKKTERLIGIAEPIKVDQLLSSLAVHKKIFRITFAAGEPFVIPGIVEACQQITRAGHHLGFNTNLTSTNIANLLKVVDAAHLDYFVASLHFWEVARAKKESVFIHNYKALREKNLITTVTAVAHPLLIKDLKYYLKFYAKHGITVVFNPFRGYYNGKLYPESYTPEEILSFGLGKYENYFNHKNTFCNAGYNVVYANPFGNVFPCASMEKENNQLGHVYSGFILKPDVVNCPEEFCGCPYKFYDHHQYRRALHETGKETFICR